MIVKNVSTLYTWVLPKHPTLYAGEGYFDLTIFHASGARYFYEGASGWATSFLQATATADGYLQDSIVFPYAGLNRMILTSGNSVGQNVLSNSVVHVVEPDTAYEMYAAYPT